LKNEISQQNDNPSINVINCKNQALSGDFSKAD